MSNQPTDKTDYDPSLAVIEFYEGLTKSWSGVLSRTVASRGVIEFIGRQVVTTFALTSWFTRQAGGLVSGSLRLLNIPTRDQIVGLAERMTWLEMAIDDLDAKLDGLQDEKRREAPRAKDANAPKKTAESELSEPG